MTGHTGRGGKAVSDHADTDETPVSGHASVPDRAGQRAADRRRAAKLRERRDQEGQVRIQAWVPRERAAYARQVLQTAAVGANTLPPDPGQQADLDTARSEAAVARAELEEARAAGDRLAQQAQSIEAAALARVEAAERGQERVTRELATVQAEVEAAQERERAAQASTMALRTELESIRSRGGWRGVLLRLAGAKGNRS